MENKEQKQQETTAQCAIQNVVGSTFYKPTMKLRWFVTEVYIPELDDFEKVLQQCWLDDKGEEIWEDVPEFNR